MRTAKMQYVYISKITTLHTSCSFVHFLAVVAWLQHETFLFHVPALWIRGKQLKNFLFFLLNLDMVLSDSSPENFTNILQIEWSWIRSMKFVTVWIHLLSDIFDLLSSRNFATTATWRNDFSSLLTVFQGFVQNNFGTNELRKYLFYIYQETTRQVWFLSWNSMIQLLALLWKMSPSWKCHEIEILLPYARKRFC